MTLTIALMITGGLVFGSLGMMSAINASIEERRARFPYLFMAGGVGVMIFGLLAAPGGLKLSNIGHAFLSVIGHMI